MTNLVIQQFNNYSRPKRREFDDIEVDLKEVMIDGCEFQRISNLEKVMSLNHSNLKKNPSKK